MKTLMYDVIINDNKAIIIINHYMKAKKDSDGKTIFTNSEDYIAFYKNYVDSVDIYINQKNHTEALLINIHNSVIKKLYSKIIEIEQNETIMSYDGEICF